MPSWNIHLAIAKEVNKKLKLDKNSFYFGNTVPDVDYNMSLTRHDTHYFNVPCTKCPKELLPDIDLFLKEYNDKLTNPVIMGTYIHLLTDYYFNSKIYSKHWIQDKDNNIIGIKLLNGIDKDIKMRKIYKHYDLELFGKHLYKQGKIEIPEYDLNIYKNMKDLNNNRYKNTDIKRRIDYLNKDFIKKQKYTLLENIVGIRYKMMTKDEIEKIYNGCIKFILKNIK